MIQPTYLFIGLNSCMSVYNSFSAQITQKGRVLVNISCGFLLPPQLNCGFPESKESLELGTLVGL